jgi:subtilisin family serine protease
MTLTPGDDLIETARQRTRDQFALLKEVHGETIIADTDDPADFNFICSSEHVLVEALAPGADPDSDDDPMNRLRRWFEDRPSQFGSVPDPPPQGRVGLARRFALPARVEPLPDGKDLLATLADIDADPDLGPGFARPDHVVHICGKGLICPATEPSETGFTRPWPARPIGNAAAGQGVRVVVVDTGWYDPTLDAQAAVGNLPWDWLGGVTGEAEPHDIRVQSGDLRAYAGHGTFVAGVIRAIAPECTVHVLNLLVDVNVPGGGVLESDLVDRLDDALRVMSWLPEDDRPEEDEPVLPDLINMSAGCPTRLNLPARAFEDWRRDLETQHADPDLVLVAAAGNNSSPWGFWPASFEWATGVGSLDRDGTVSDFSNWGDSVDVFALGRNIINAFPNGTYPCHESPDLGESRFFANWLARWSGTSFAAPIVTGLIAAEMSAQQQPRSARVARDAVVSVAAPLQRPALRATSVPVAASDLLVVAGPSGQNI